MDNFKLQYCKSFSLGIIKMSLKIKQFKLMLKVTC